MSNWKEHPHTRQMALDIVSLWNEFIYQYERQIGERDDLIVEDLSDMFSFTKTELESGWVDG